jgi:peroxiredoxin Q/BCP
MATINQGDIAPAFSVNDQHGNQVSLSDFLGKTVVLYFYPKDATPGCTAEACDFRDNYQILQAKGLVVLGVSTDDEKSHTKFIGKFQLPFTLLADTDKKLVEAYGVWVEKSMYGKIYMGTARKTFIINPEGKIAHIIEKVETSRASQQILDLLG